MDKGLQKLEIRRLSNLGLIKNKVWKMEKKNLQKK